jgi:hypothetical protein
MVSKKMFQSLVQVLSRFPNVQAFYVAAPQIRHLEDNDFRSFLDIWRSHCPHLVRITFRNFPVIVDSEVKKSGYHHGGDRGWVRDDSRLAIDEEFDFQAYLESRDSDAAVTFILELWNV